MHAIDNVITKSRWLALSGDLDAARGDFQLDREEYARLRNE
jgi:hypothetical protein